MVGIILLDPTSRESGGVSELCVVPTLASNKSCLLPQLNQQLCYLMLSYVSYCDIFIHLHLFLLKSFSFSFST